MEFTIKRTDKGVCAIRISGPLNIYEAAKFKQALEGVLRDAVSFASVEVDLSEVSELDTTGVQLLVLARREAVAMGKGFRVTGAGGAPASAFETYSLKDFLSQP